MGAGAWGVATDRGLVRALNEDSYIAEATLFVVADGMGGHSAGDIASAVAVESLANLVATDPISPDQVIDAIGAANRAILGVAETDPTQVGMGTTLSGLAAVSVGGAAHWIVFNVGDSRVYRLADGRLEQLTVDHSEAEEMVLAGRISREEARSYPRRNVVTRSLGTDPAPSADSWVFPPEEDERFLICSDGLTAGVSDEAIRTCLLSHTEPQAAADALVGLAIESGGLDNVTVVVVDGDANSVSPVDEDTQPR